MTSPKVELKCKNCNRAFLLQKAFVRGQRKRNPNACSFCCLPCARQFRSKKSWEERKCKVCGIEFRYKKNLPSDRNTGEYCSRKCADIGHRKPESWEITWCIKCGKKIRGKVYHKRKYCSYACSGLARNRVTLKCDWCEKDYEVRKSREGTSHYCSRSCCAKAWSEYRRKEKLNRHNRLQTKGWGRLRLKVLERDDYTCQQCGCQDGKTLAVHHIVPWRLTQDDSLKNLTTLCRACHFYADMPYIPLHIREEIVRQIGI